MPASRPTTSKRPNHHFGQWDLHHVDNRGYYRRFVLQRVIENKNLTTAEFRGVGRRFEQVRLRLADRDRDHARRRLERRDDCCFI
jgi:hypothetical protein